MATPHKHSKRMHEQATWSIQAHKTGGSSGRRAREAADQWSSGRLRYAIQAHTHFKTSPIFAYQIYL